MYVTFQMIATTFQLLLMISNLIHLTWLNHTLSGGSMLTSNLPPDPEHFHFILLPYMAVECVTSTLYMHLLRPFNTYMDVVLNMWLPLSK